MPDKSHVNLILAWGADHERFMREALRFEKISNQQLQACKEVDKLISAKVKKGTGQELTEEEAAYAKKTGISIMSGQGTGKDAWIASLIIKMLVCFPRVKIPCTAPTGHQLKDVLWAEISKWLRDSAVKEWVVWQAEKVYWKEAEGREWFAVARTVNTKGTVDEQAETLAGFHEDYMMVVVEEASGVPEPVFKPLEGTLTGLCNFAVLIFNPTRNNGFAIESHRKDRERWVPIHWNAEESDIVQPDAIERMAKKYGKDSNVYRIRVKGLPPVSTTDTLIQWDWAMNAVNREVYPLPEDPVILILDPGGGGDPSCLTRRRGPVFESFELRDIAESEMLIGWVMRQIFDHEPALVLLDVIGLGYAIEGALRTRCSGVNIIGINWSEASAENQRFYRLRDELCWRAREEFEQGIISIPDDPMLIAEATTIKFDDQRPDGTIKIESKKDMKKRGIESPNKFDTVALSTFYTTQMMRRFASKDRQRWRREPVDWRTA